MRTPMVTPKARICLVAAGLGFVSLVFPWATGFRTDSGQVVVGQTPFDLVYRLASAHASTNGYLNDWLTARPAGFGVWTIGALVFVLGCLLVALQGFTSIRWAGLQMSAGVAVSAAGVLSITGTYHFGDVTLLFIPSFGLGLGAIASIIALEPLFSIGPLDRWERAPKLFITASLYTRYLEATLKEANKPESRGATPKGETAGAGTGDAIASPLARFCPECGQWFLQTAQRCQQDGATLKPVRTGLGAESQLRTAPGIRP